MKYFRNKKASFGLPDRIILDERILEIYFDESGNVVFMEGCDNYFFRVFSPHEAVDLLNEAIEWIKKTVEMHT